MENDKIYGIDKNGNVYVIDILFKYIDEIVGNITNFDDEVKRVKFYLKPQQDFYKIKGCSDPKFDFIWKKDVICSFSKNDIITIKHKMFHEYYDKEIKKIEGEIKKLEERKHLNISFERFNFEKLDLKDEVILYSKYLNKRCNGVVTSLITFDKTNFLPRISCNDLEIDNVSIDVVDNVNKLNGLYNDILVFRDNNDLDNYLKNQENIEIEEDIKGCKWELNGYINLKNRGFDISF